MSHSHEDKRFPDDLEDVADALRDARPTLDPLALDRVKLRAMSAAKRPSSAHPKGILRQRLAALLTVGLLVLGTGGTLALAGGGGAGRSASFDQYKPPPCVHGKGAGLPNECPGEKPEPPCVHGKGRHLPNECPGEKPEQGKGPHGGKGKGQGGKGHGGKGKGPQGKGKGSHGGKGKGQGGKGKGNKGAHGGKHGHKSGHGGKSAHGHH